MDPVSRVAVDASCLSHTASIDLAPNLSEEMIQLVSDAVGAAIPLYSADSVKISGPGWSIVSVDEADQLSVQQRNSLVPIRSRSSLAMITTWVPGALTVQIFDKDKKLIAFVEPDFDADAIDIRSSGESSKLIGTFEMRKVDEFRRILSLQSPLTQIPPGACGKVGKMGGDSNAFSMPAWVGELAVRWLSQCLRFHVVFHASFPNGVSRPLTLNSCFLNKISEGKHTRWRLSMIVHEYSCQCICNTWKKDRKDQLGTPKRVSVSIDFCGCDKIDGYCPVHPGCASRRHTNTAEACQVCLHGVDMKMSCRHLASGQLMSSGTCCPTQIRFKSAFQDSFMETLLCVCRTLSKLPNEERQAELRELLQESLKKAAIDYKTTCSVSDETMKERDAFVCAMLETGQYFVSSKRKLHQKNASRSVPAYLNEMMESHAHLLPSS